MDTWIGGGVTRGKAIFTCGGFTATAREGGKLNIKVKYKIHYAPSLSKFNCGGTTAHCQDPQKGLVAHP